MATCQRCGQTFTSVLQLGAHIRTHQEQDESASDVENDDIPLLTAPAPLCDLANRPPGSWGREESFAVAEVESTESTDFLSRDYREVCTARIIS